MISIFIVAIMAMTFAAIVFSILLWKRKWIRYLALLLALCGVTFLIYFFAVIAGDLDT